jgi:hypothetical protein
MVPAKPEESLFDEQSLTRMDGLFPAEYATSIS